MSIEKIQTDVISYSDGDIEMNGYIAWDETLSRLRPGILVVHEWWGQNEYVRERAEMLAKMGYTAMAVDLYGNGQTASNPEEATALMNDLLSDTTRLRYRFDAAANALRGHSHCESDKIGAIGYCMGGAVVLHAARTGAMLDAVASFHGDLSLAVVDGPDDIVCRIAAYNGEADSFVSAESIAAFKAEMERIGADYHFIQFPGALHGFSNPAATERGEKYGLPLRYSAAADQSSWAHMRLLFKETFFPA